MIKKRDFTLAWDQPQLEAEFAVATMIALTCLTVSTCSRSGRTTTDTRTSRPTGLRLVR